MSTCVIAMRCLALAMGRSHLRKLEHLGAGDRAHLLGEFVGAVGDVEVADPVGGPIEGYRSTYQQLEAMTRSAAQRIAQEVKGDRR